MRSFLKWLAIVMLVITVAGAGAVLYALTMFEPKVEQVQVTATPAAQAEEVFASLMEQAANGTFAGRLYAQTQGLRAQDCTFLTYTVRFANRGFFPAEWIHLRVEPRVSQDGASYDVLQMEDTGAYVLDAGSRGDLSATLLCCGDATDRARTLRATCYVFGRSVSFDIAAE